MVVIQNLLIFKIWEHMHQELHKHLMCRLISWDFLTKLLSKCNASKTSRTKYCVLPSVTYLLAQKQMKNAQKQNQISDGNPLYVLAISDNLVLNSFESGPVWFVRVLTLSLKEWEIKVWTWLMYCFDMSFKFYHFFRAINQEFWLRSG